MEHVKLFWSRLNIPQLLTACKQNLHWPEAVFLYRNYDQYENAVDIMIQHSAESWRHDLFKETISQVSNTEIYYRAIDFYLEEHPLLLNDLLLDLSNSLDHTRVVNTISRAKHLPLVEKYLLNVQSENLSAVNTAVNRLFITEEKFRALRESIDAYDQFDQVALAQELEKHELVEFRRISAYLYKRNKRFEKSIALSKADLLWGDTMETVAESEDREAAEELLSFFVERGEHECFAAQLFTCYALIRPDIVMELAWRNNLMDFAMPFMIQTVREYDEKLSGITNQLEAQRQAKIAEEQAAKAAAEEQASNEAAMVGGPGYNPMMAPLALAPPPMMGGGMGYGGQIPGGFPGQPPSQPFY